MFLSFAIFASWCRTPGPLPAPAIFPCGENAVGPRSTGFPEGSDGAGRGCCQVSGVQAAYLENALACLLPSCTTSLTTSGR